MLTSLLSLLRSAPRTTRRAPARPCLESLGERSLPSGLYPAPAYGPGQWSSPDYAVPLHLSGAGVGTFVPPPADAVAAFTFEASGNATHLGKWTNEGYVEFRATSDPNRLAASGTVKYTAANGDELYATISGTFDVQAQVGTATFTWQGGTGRFANATGSADFVVHNQGEPGAPTFTFDFTAEGTISYSGLEK